MSVQQSSRRSREGAWIEMLAAALHTANAGVAPARERGLKWFTLAQLIRSYSRSREGAWIEILYVMTCTGGGIGRSREGAWIEMAKKLTLCRENQPVAPARERGLKCRFLLHKFRVLRSLPRGSVD